MPPQISHASLDDLNLLSDLFDEYRVWYGQPSDRAAAHAFLQERLLLGESVILLAHLNGVPAGFTQLYRSFSSVRMKRLWILNDLFVRSEFRGQRVGVALLDAARDLAVQSGARGVALETAGDNLAAQRLYDHYGFRRSTGVHYLLEVGEPA
ncbi:GNAT family N-acetyltransferase [Deinococcus sp. Marseille-Q6407]|uniref:GNAT family N-acetyltransferase n=1 Tax=Deinococcus sp. Marseille-Q6407 TaxID=2969223 RepID=UPI0021C16E42|nr:GNAT family N-acetyltransferase [Deinococcus sp. Marseille-Q6407]